MKNAMHPGAKALKFWERGQDGTTKVVPFPEAESKSTRIESE